MALYGDKLYGKVKAVGEKLVYKNQPLKTWGGLSNNQNLKNNQGSGTNNQTVSTANTTKTANTTVPKQRTPVAYDPKSNSYGIRSAFQNSGLDASKLTWDGNYVGYNGIKLKPSAVGDGITYASMNDINDFIRRSYESDGRTLVQANQYSNPYGLNGLEWNDGTKQATINGVPVDYAYADENGNVWVDKEVMDSMYDNYAYDVGVRASADIYNEYKDRMSAYDQMRDNIMNDKWSYDLENDIAYQAYKTAYERNAQKAYNDMLGNLVGRNGGGMSSAAQLASSAAYNEQMQMLNDRIPELQQNAYNRWLEDRNARLEDIMAKENNAYNLYATATDANQTAYDKENTRREAALQRMYEPLNMQNAKMETQNTVFASAMERGTQRGFFTDEEATLLGLKRKADGSWPKPWEAELNYNIDSWNLVEKPKLAYQYGQEALQQATQHGYNMEEKYMSADMDGDGVVTEEELKNYKIWNQD